MRETECGKCVENFNFPFQFPEKCGETAQTLPTPITIPTLRTLVEKNPVFDGRVLIALGTYQREMLKEHGLVVNIVNS